MNTVFRSANHCFDQSPTILIREQGYVPGPIIIGDDVWLRANVVVLPNVRIGGHSIIGAGSIVTKDIPSCSVAYGIPASVRRSLAD
jgi:acetyltransferase-like isoleucine patch superfamily enzyme